MRPFPPHSQLGWPDWRPGLGVIRSALLKHSMTSAAPSEASESSGCLTRRRSPGSTGLRCALQPGTLPMPSPRTSPPPSKCLTVCRLSRWLTVPVPCCGNWAAVRLPAPGDHDQRRLSDREEEVARLVAQGLSNAEVGERLFISSRTVSTHLQHIYRRLELRSRAALIRYVLDGSHLPEVTSRGGMDT